MAKAIMLCMFTLPFNRRLNELSLSVPSIVHVTAIILYSALFHRHYFTDYERNQDFRGAPISLPDLVLVDWPTHDFRQLDNKFSKQLPPIIRILVEEVIPLPHQTPCFTTFCACAVSACHTCVKFNLVVNYSRSVFSIQFILCALYREVHKINKINLIYRRKQRIGNNNHLKLLGT